MTVALEDVCKRIYAGGDVPKNRYSAVKTEEFSVPIYANAEKDNGLYGYTDEARENELCITVAARGTIGFVTIRNEPFLPVVRLITVVPDTTKVSVRYLYYALKNSKPKSSGTSIPQLTVPDIKKNRIELFSIENQEKIADILDIISNIIISRRHELQMLDNLIKARFVEMFGDPATNPKGWNKAGISTVMQGKASNGYFAKRDEYAEEGNVAILGVAYVVNRMYSQVDGLPRTNASVSDIQKYSVKYGDMLFCRSSLVAEGIGKASIVPENTPDNTLFECHVIRLPLDLTKCVPEFMQVLSTTDYFRNQIIAQSKTATMTTIGQDGILKAEIILPPIEKQREFYSFVKQIDKSKVAVQKALDEAQLLFNSLMQKYFG
ncbi:MAG: restriction endonuclease subunit S [Clostridia bacterium]|nr:restriction endonuclease subunit S [Clostridia bacterium]